MGDFDHIARCQDLAESDIASAIESRAGLRELVERMTAVSRPSDGGPKVLLVFARLASAPCDWLDGDLHVTLAGNDASTTIDVLAEIGAGLKERVIPSVTMTVPAREFEDAIETYPHALDPIEISRTADGKLVLRAPASARGESIPAPMEPTPLDSPAEPPSAPTSPRAESARIARIRLRQQAVAPQRAIEEIVDSSRHVDVAARRPTPKENAQRKAPVTRKAKGSERPKAPTKPNSAPPKVDSTANAKSSTRTPAEGEEKAKEDAGEARDDEWE